MLHSMYIFTLGYMMQWYTTNKSVHFRGDHGSLRLRNLCIWWYLALSNFALLKHFILGRRCCLYAFSLNIVSSMDTYTPYELYVQYKCMFKIVEDQRKKTEYALSKCTQTYHKIPWKLSQISVYKCMPHIPIEFPCISWHPHHSPCFSSHLCSRHLEVSLSRFAWDSTLASQLPLFEWTTA